MTTATTALRPGDIVTGPSLHDPKVRRWVLLYMSNQGGIAAGHNLAAKRPWRHLLDVNNLRPTGKRDESYRRWIDAG